MRDGVAVLKEVRALGGFFAVETSVVHSSWVPLSSLVDGSGGLAAHIDRTRIALAAGSGIDPERLERRVAASIMQQSLTARMVSPALASAAIAGWVPRMSIDRVWWQPTKSNPVPLALPEPHGSEARTPDELAGLIAGLVLDDGVACLATAVENETHLNDAISWGNVASSVVGATGVLARQLPAVADTAAAICRSVLATLHLAAAGEFEASGQFRRKSCCLYYRLPNGGLCGDCVLAH